MAADRKSPESQVEVSEVVQAFMQSATPRQRLRVLLHAQPVFLPPSQAPRIPRLPRGKVRPRELDMDGCKERMNELAQRLQPMTFPHVPRRIESSLVFALEANATQLKQMASWSDVLARITPNRVHKL